MESTKDLSTRVKELDAEIQNGSLTEDQILELGDLFEKTRERITEIEAKALRKLFNMKREQLEKESNQKKSQFDIQTFEINFNKLTAGEISFQDFLKETGLG